MTWYSDVIAFFTSSKVVSSVCYQHREGNDGTFTMRFSPEVRCNSQMYFIYSLQYLINLNQVEPILTSYIFSRFKKKSYTCFVKLFFIYSKTVYSSIFHCIKKSLNFLTNVFDYFQILVFLFSLILVFISLPVILQLLKRIIQYIWLYYG